MLTQAQLDSPPISRQCSNGSPDQPAGAHPAGEPVGGDHDGRAVRGRPGELLQRLGHPLGHLRRALPRRRTADVLPRAQPAGQLGIGLVHLAAGQSLPGADVDLPQPLVGDDLQTGQLGQRATRSGTPATGRWSTGPKARRRRASARRCAACAMPQRIEPDVGLTLESVGPVPFGPPVPPDDDPRGGHRRSSTSSEISGQSRQSRSRE